MPVSAAEQLSQMTWRPSSPRSEILSLPRRPRRFSPPSCPRRGPPDRGRSHERSPIV